MNFTSGSFAIALFASPLFAQSAPVIVVQPEGGSVVHGTSGAHYYVRQVQPPASPRGANAAPLVIGQLVVPGPREGEPWLGLSMRSRTDGGERLEVDEVMGGSPAERAGVQVGDKLVAFGGRAVPTHDDLMAVLREHHSGDHVGLTVERTLKAKLGETTDEGKKAFLGVTTAIQGETEGQAAGVGGLTVSQVERNSAAASAGLVVGERISAVAGVEVGSAEELRKAVRSHQPGEQVELRVQRDLNVELAPRPGKTDGNRAIAGQGLGAFNPHASSPHTEGPSFDAFGGHAGPLPPSHPGGGGQGPHTAQPLVPHDEADQGGRQQAEGFLWQPEQPQDAQPGAQSHNRSQPRERAAPSSPRTERPNSPRGQRFERNSAGQDQVATDLLEELRALRAEVADLRREIESLRGKGR